MPRRIKSIAEKYWEKVVKGSEPDECWLWLGGTNEDGYGRFGRGELAHRIAFQVHTGEHPGNFYVLHRCDNPPCTNDRHLYKGTQFDNMRDMVQKGRQNKTSRNKGKDHGMAKLTDDQVRLIKSSQGEQKLLAKQLNVSPSLVCHIRAGKGWTHIQCEENTNERN